MRNSVVSVKKNEKRYNENWEAEIAAYDAECSRIEREFYEHHLIIKESGNADLTAEENEVLTLYLNGVQCKDIAKQYDVEEEVITGLLEVIRAKLSLYDP